MEENITYLIKPCRYPELKASRSPHKFPNSQVGCAPQSTHAVFRFSDGLNIPLRPSETSVL